MIQIVIGSEINTDRVYSSKKNVFNVMWTNKGTKFMYQIKKFGVFFRFVFKCWYINKKKIDADEGK